MYYVIEAVRWTPQGQMSHVRWHGVDADGETVVHAPAQVVPVVDAAAACDSDEVRVYVAGDPGRFVRMKSCPAGIDADEDSQGRPLRERMAHLPVF